MSRSAVPGPEVVTQLENNSVLGAVLASGFRALNSNPRCSEADLRASIEAAGRQASHQLERYLTALATIASAAPPAGPAGHGHRHDRDLWLPNWQRRCDHEQPGAAGTGHLNCAVQHRIWVDRCHSGADHVAVLSRPGWTPYLLTLELSAERFMRHLNGLRRP